MKLVWLLVKISVLLLLFAFMYIYFDTNFDIPQGVSYETIKAIEEPSFLSLLLSSQDFSRIREDGFNTIVITVKHPVIGGRPRQLPFLYTATAFLIKKAHVNGLSVFLVPEITFKERNEKLFNDKIFKDDAILISRNWADFAKRYHVEYLSPLKTPEKIFGIEKGAIWALEVLPDIRERYDGKVAAYFGSALQLKKSKENVPIFSSCMSQNNNPQNLYLFVPEIRGYDFIVLSAVPLKEIRNFDLFAVDMKRYVPKLKLSALRNGSGTVVFSGLNAPVSPTDYFGREFGPVVTEKEQAELIKSLLELMSQTGTGFIVTGWSNSSFGIRGRLAEEAAKSVIKEKEIKK